MALFVVLGAVVAATISLTGGAAAVPVEPTVQGAVSKDQPALMEADGRADPASHSLVADLGIAPRDAEMQMTYQVAAGIAERDMPKDLRAVFGGRSIDHANGGLVTVGVTDVGQAEPMQRYYVSAGVPQVQVSVVAATLDEAEGVVDRLNEELRNSSRSETDPHVAVWLGSIGHVTVERVPGPLDEFEASVLQQVEKNPARFEVRDVERIVPAKKQACDYAGTINCDPPLRGSVRIGDGTWRCTAGFNARSRTDDKPYVLTAGHCESDDTWSARFSDYSLHWVGRFHRAINNADTDVGIITVNNPSGWSFGWPMVTVDPTGGEAANDTYVIDHVLNPALGDRVCWTGSFSSRTDCGNVVVQYGTQGGTDGLFKVSDLCSRQGDSGGPYFAAHVAYGVHTAGKETGCTGGWAEQAPEAEDQLNVNVVTT